MSMNGGYVRVEEPVIDEIKAGKISLDSILFADPLEEEFYLDIDKSWHVMHYLLCGETWEGEPPLCNVVLGGEEINDEDLGYGPARYLLASEVKEVYEAIKDIAEDTLKQGFDVDDLNQKDIYPSFIEEDFFEYVWTNFVEVQEFFKKAAQEGKAMILYLY